MSAQHPKQEREIGKEGKERGMVFIQSSVPRTVTLHSALSKFGSSLNKHPALPFPVFTTAAPTTFPSTLSTPLNILQRNPVTTILALSKSILPNDAKINCFSHGSLGPICFHRLKKSSAEKEGAGAINLCNTTGSLRRSACREPATKVILMMGASTKDVWASKFRTHWAWVPPSRVLPGRVGDE
jgi:hypothetical protein